MFATALVTSAATLAPCSDDDAGPDVSCSSAQTSLDASRAQVAELAGVALTITAIRGRFPARGTPAAASGGGASLVTSTRPTAGSRGRSPPPTSFHPDDLRQRWILSIMARRLGRSSPRPTASAEPSAGVPGGVELRPRVGDEHLDARLLVRALERERQLGGAATPATRRTEAAVHAGQLVRGGVEVGTGPDGDGAPTPSAAPRASQDDRPAPRHASAVPTTRRFPPPTAPAAVVAGRSTTTAGGRGCRDDG